ncbi:MAG TPA: hypothetical protein VHP36_09720 [Chitinispirillaceae bacterium]|nr:hypothetical protein [Chitinispirillaceae bacterium]
MNLQYKLLAISMMTALCSYISAMESQIQMESKAAFVSTAPLSPFNTTEKNGFALYTDFNVSRPFTENLSILFNQRLQGYGTKSVFPERQLPVENYIYAGIRLDGNYGILQLGESNQLFPDSKHLSMPNLPSGTKLHPRMINGVDASWNIEKERFDVSATTTYFVNSFTLVPNNKSIDPVLIDLPPYGKAYDADLWTNINIGFLLFSPIRIEAGTLLKNDLNNSNSCNLNDYQLGLSATHAGARKKLFFDWALREHYLGSESVEAAGGSVGFSTQCIMRMMYKIKPKFLISCVSDIELSSDMLKLRYEASIRKQWKKGSTVNFSHCGTSGVLFPRQITSLKSTLRLFDHFGVAPDISIAFGKTGTDSRYKYYRSDYALELLFPLVNRIEAFGKYNFRQYSDHPLFSSRNIIALGIRTW